MAPCMSSILALSVSDKIDQYGAYAGFASVLGLAILSLLYFAQAREVKRLREWAGRAPERARELEERALAAAEEARRRPAPAPVAQPRPQAAPVAAAAPAAATAGARSGTVGPAVPVAAAGAAVAEQERPVGGQGGEPIAHGPVTEDGRPPAPALPRASDADEPELAERDDEDPRDEAEDADPEADGSPAAAEPQASAPTNGAP